MVYNPFLVYCRELGSGTVSLTGDRAQGDDSKHDSHYRGVGGSILKQTERRQFHLFNDKRHNFKYISYACVEGIPQSFGNEGHLYP